MDEEMVGFDILIDTDEVDVNIEDVDTLPRMLMMYSYLIVTSFMAFLYFYLAFWAFGVDPAFQGLGVEYWAALIKWVFDQPSKAEWDRIFTMYAKVQARSRNEQLREELAGPVLDES